MRQLAKQSGSKAVAISVEGSAAEVTTHRFFEMRRSNHQRGACTSSLSKSRGDSAPIERHGTSRRDAAGCRD